ncbi:hypothetical protein ACKWTF_010433 [Chironomus riparius]
MVCIPCFIVPVVLFFWRWLIQPYFIKYIWNPWQKKDETGKVIENEPEFIKKCENGVCKFMRKPAEDGSGDTKVENPHIKETEVKKND